MLFNSYEFIFVFVPFILIVYYGLILLKCTKLAIVSLVSASLFFYGFWDIYNVPILMASIVVNYWLGRKIGEKRLRVWMVVGVSANLVLLIYYKYIVFIVQNLILLGLPLSFPNVGALPLGISFFTFTQIAYLVDIYRGEQTKYSFIRYCLFVTFFPHLIAGPILYHKDIIPQLANEKIFNFSYSNFTRGITLFSLGLFKKVIIADSLIEWIAPVFAHTADISFGEAWIGVLAYTFQLYYDFSGYSDMAIGLGWLFNINLPVNFNSPYRTTSMIKTWNRWHITLVTFLTNYVFIPLGGARGNYGKTMRNILITFLVAGIWHGAGWNFILWGLLNGMYLVINHTWRRWGHELPSVPAWCLTFLSIVAGMVLFRADSISDAANLFSVMSGYHGIVLPAQYANILPATAQWFVQFADWRVLTERRFEVLDFLALLLVVTHTIPNTNQLMKAYQPNWRWAVLAGVLLSVSILKLQRVSEFLYFQF